MGVSTKRRFIGLAFFPYGGDISANLGLAGMSPDVERLEERAAQDGYSIIMGNAGRLDSVLKLAEWYVDAFRCVEEHTLPGNERTLQEHLVNFFMTAERFVREDGHV